jgi:hypothetical protein
MCYLIREEKQILHVQHDKTNAAPNSMHWYQAGVEGLKEGW